MPYPLNRQDDGSYQFTSSHHSIYTIYFVDGTAYIPDGPFSHDVLMVGFSSSKKRPYTSDPRIGPTVVQALQFVSDANPNAILVYVCDASDGKQRAWVKLFNDWFNQASAGFDHFTHQQIEPDFAHYSGMLMRSNNPWRIQAVELAK